MRILIDLINFPDSGGASYDWRYTLWIKICKELEKLGHEISCNRQKGVEDGIFKTHNDDLLDFYICHTPYGNFARENRRKIYLKNKIPVICYDHGWLPKSIIVDRKKLFGDSYYADKIESIIKDINEYHSTEEFRQYLLNNNISKREQTKKDTIPNVKYIFIPGQVLNDASIVYYSNTGMLEFINKVVQEASKYKLHVIYKPHPGILDLKSHGKKELRNYTFKLKEKYNNFHIVNTSVYDLMKNAEFTACVSSGSMIDNLVTQTPVYCCGRTFYSKSGAVVFNENVEVGIRTMVKKEYDFNKMLLRQKQLLHWLRDNLIQEEFDNMKNIELIEKHSGVKLT